MPTAPRAPAAAPRAPAAPRVSATAPKSAVVTAPAPAKAVARTRAQLGTEFVYFLVENAYGYKGKFLLKLKDVGLVNVIGQNLESKVPSSSGAGKTRVWRLFLYLLYGKVALEGVENVKDLNVFGENFRLEIGYIARDGKAYVLRDCKKHASYPDGLTLVHCPEGFNSRTRVAVDGCPENAPTLLRAFVQSQINLTYKEATGTVIWPQGFGHTLIRGKPSERVQWLSDLNGLTQYDEMHRDFADRLKAVKAEINSLLEFRGQYHVIEEDLKSLTSGGSIEEIRQHGRTIKAAVAELDVKITSARATKSALDLEVANLKRLATAVTAVRAHQLDPSERDQAIRGCLLSSFERDIAGAAASVDQARRTLDDYDRYSALCVELEGIETPEHVDDLRAEQSKLLSDDLPRAKQESNLSIENPEDVDAVASDLQSDLETNSSLLQIEATPAAASAFITQTRTRLAVISGQISSNNASRQRMSKALALTDGHECPVCMQTVTNTQIIRDAVKEIDDETATLTTEKNQLDSDLTYAQDILDICAELAAIPERKNKAVVASAARESVPVIQRRLSELHSTLSRSQVLVQKITERDLLAERIAGVDVAAIEAQLADLESVSEANNIKRDAYQLAQADYDFAYSVASDLGFEDPFAVSADTEVRNKQVRLDQIATWLVKAEEKQRADNAKIQQFLGIVRQHTEKSAHLSELTASVDRLLVLEDEEVILAACVKSYSKTGMKVEKLKAIMDRISERLPVWVRLLFTEPHFAVRVSGDATKLSLQVRKKFVVDDKPLIKWVDASALSGGEESRFAICIMLTLSELVAPEKRTNLMVLDETDRSCDAFGQQLIASILIPLMRRRKPSMFVITHQLHLDPSVVDANLYVTKHKNGLTDLKLIPSLRSR